MTERSVPIVGGASVCPFVAFEDNREERASRPDHRHRCFADVRPATRALAHQEAYCLSPAFPACPTFQDWARREAARARATAPNVRAPDPIDEPVARAPRRDWSAPPPWIDESPGSSRATVAEGAGLAESAGLAVAEGAALADAPSFLAERPGPPAAAVPPSSGVRPTSGAGRSTAGRGRGRSATVAGRPTRLTTTPTGTLPTVERPVGSIEPAIRAPAERQRLEARQAEPGRPSWSGPSATRRTPRSDPHRPAERAPIAFAFVGLIAPALLLFFVPPMFIRPGGEADTGGGATPTPSAEPAASFAPTPIPAPTPQVYVIAAGTLSKVAKSYGLSLEELLAVNPSIKNPDKIAIGDEIVIPAPVPSEVVDAGGAGASVEPSVAP
jgi:hypothetical protein